MRPMRLLMIKVGGKVFGSLGLGELYKWSRIMLFLQQLHSGLPMWPQPLQEWGARRSRRLGNVVFFTIFDIFLLILLWK